MVNKNRLIKKISFFLFQPTKKHTKFDNATPKQIKVEFEERTRQESCTLRDINSRIDQ